MITSKRRQRKLLVILSLDMLVHFVELVLGYGASLILIKTYLYKYRNNLRLDLRLELSGSPSLNKVIELNDGQKYTVQLPRVNICFKV